MVFAVVELSKVPLMYSCIKPVDLFLVAATCTQFPVFTLDVENIVRSGFPTPKATLFPTNVTPKSLVTPPTSEFTNPIPLYHIPPLFPTWVVFIQNSIVKLS